MFIYTFDPAYSGQTPYELDFGSALPNGTWLAADGGSPNFSTPYTDAGIVGGPKVPEPSSLSMLGLDGLRSTPSDCPYRTVPAIISAVAVLKAAFVPISTSLTASATSAAPVLLYARIAFSLESDPVLLYARIAFETVRKRGPPYFLPVSS